MFLCECVTDGWVCPWGFTLCVCCTCLCSICLSSSFRCSALCCCCWLDSLSSYRTQIQSSVKTLHTVQTEDILCVFSPVPESAGVSSSPPPVHWAETAAQSSLKHTVCIFLHLWAIFLLELVKHHLHILKSFNVSSSAQNSVCYSLNAIVLVLFSVS